MAFARGTPGDGRSKSGLGITSVFLVNRDRPVLVLGGVAADGAEVDVLELLREFPDLAVADRAPVDLDHRRDLRSGAAQQQLVTCVDLGGRRIIKKKV